MEHGSPISRLPTLALHLSCRFPAVRVHGPHYKMAIVVEKETFGIPRFWMEFYPPGEGPFANEMQPGSEPEPEHLLDVLDLHVFSNTSLDRAELMVSTCVESETPDFKETYPLLQEGCTRGNAELQVISEINNVRIYRINLANLITKKNTMYVECVVRLCVAILPSQKCPDECRDSKTRSLVETVFTRDYIVRSGPVFLGNGRPTSAPSTTTTTTTTPSVMLLSHAPEDSFLVVGVAVGVIQMLLQTLLQ
ncbi:hypothetical protein SKAU_G00315500 [Synaphobranchus kaupii]|uniref:ZP domain-containing protein n=1 Tax=Synaphobranchus kaupii TaxID=118154 RepID=A0A9Q1ESJ3_SYNKA|nr:hypothetical protein SKAU_G00315500 [Synaphobranchus kaupii]